jgi:hypothetical protein
MTLAVSAPKKPPEAAKLTIITTSYNMTTDYTYNLVDSMVQADISTPEADQQGNVTYNEVISTNAYNAQGGCDAIYGKTAVTRCTGSQKPILAKRYMEDGKKRILHLNKYETPCLLLKMGHLSLS